MPTQRDSTDATGRIRLTAKVVNTQPVVVIKFNVAIHAVLLGELFEVVVIARNSRAIA